MTLHLRQHRDLYGTTAAAAARDLTRHFFDDASRVGRSVAPEVRDTTLLLVSELVTNAIRHTADGCALDLELEPDGIGIDVTDSSSIEPQRRPPDLQGGGGWGWALVNQLGRDVRIRHLPSGKTIHTRVPLPPAI
ncbi:ATP-binding protein [Streptomyces sp. NPDC058646]|uniref:ATP-binding protein n=1 Tax=Streptomyces sp. NPDC058646 TaxID=3346574 RepID=UPI00364638E8